VLARGWLSIALGCLGACGASGGGPSRPAGESVDAGALAGGEDGAPVASREVRSPAPDGSLSCELAIEALIEVVDREGRPFPRDPGGTFLVPITADDFAFDAGGSWYVSTHDVLYTFSSDCFPRVTVHAPVFGGFGTQGFWIDKRCACMVEIVDRGCAEGREAHAQAAFRIVPP
jgi:hypothetical protein